MTIMVVAPGFSLHTKRFIDTLLLQGHKVVAVGQENPFPGKRDNFCFIRPFLLFPAILFMLALIHRFALLTMGKSIGFRLRTCVAGLLMKCTWLRVKPDLVYLLWVDTMANICVAGGLRPLVLQVWGSDINQHFLPGADPIAREFCGHALSDADLVIYDAPDMKNKCEILARKPIKSVFFHFGVDTTLFTTRPLSVRKLWRGRFNIHEDAVVLLSPRAWNPTYRHHDVLEAFALSIGKLSRQAYLVFKLLNGNNDSEFEHNSYKNHVMNRAETLGISDRVIWLKEMKYEELPELYAMSDIVVNFPKMDALGITLMEAAACNRHIISISLPCYKGTFVEKYAKMVSDVNELEMAIIDAVNEPPSGDLLMNARKEVETYFDSHFFYENLETVNNRF